MLATRSTIVANSLVPNCWCSRSAKCWPRLGQFSRWDDLAEGGEYHGVLTGFVRLVHPLERLHRGRQPRPGARAGRAAGGGLAEQELGDHASPGVLDEQRGDGAGVLAGSISRGNT